ncbi:MAG: acyltransferase [Pseudomonadota bacterium]|nr:acyltransferase [Pseudomonadota bacterium]
MGSSKLNLRPDSVDNIIPRLIVWGIWIMNEKSAMAYRPDVDGLRAVAILAVVAYHVGLPLVNGGFVGVDIFFVISGYLITGLLKKELTNTGTIHIGDFIARRIRRLLPAFFLVMTATLLGAMLTMFPQELPRMGKSSIAAALVSSNFHFLNYSGGYFDPSTDIMPLLHTWSLGVEEQYYFIWPLLLLLVWRFAIVTGQRQTVVAMIVLLVVFLGSFLGNVFFIESRHALVYYMMPFRAWEFALGGLLVWAEPGLRHQSRWPGELLFVLGGLLVSWSIFLPGDIAVYPGWQAAIPVAGAAALIAAGSNERSLWSRKLLGSQFMVRIGLISYSWYLWHWPMLALSRAHDLGARSLFRDSAISLVALVLAWATNRFVENPIRYRRPVGFQSTRGTLISGGLITLAIVAPILST